MKTQLALDLMEKGDHITLFLKNGEVITGLFQFIDGDNFDGDVVLKPVKPSKTIYDQMSLGWKIAFIKEIEIENLED